MIATLSQRTLEGLLVLLLMSLLVYLLIGLMPGDPIDLMIAANPELSSADAERLRQLHGLDRPLLERYGLWLTQALQGDLGYSRLTNQPVLETLWPRLSNTVILMGISLLLSILIALPLGVLAALKPQGWADTLINLIAFAGISVPPFWLAILLIILFAVTLGWLPAGGMAPEGGGLLEQIKYLALPVATLTLGTVSGLVRFLRASMIEALQQDFILTARAMGLPRSRVIWGQALRYALLPVITILALNFGNLFSGALITETMFSYLGMGKTIYDAIMGNDYNLALAGLLLATFVTLAANIAADFVYLLLDPRIRLD